MKMMKTQHVTLLVLLTMYSIVNGFLCPNDGLFINVNDETTYYQCESGIDFLFRCPTGQVWNQVNHHCEFPSVQGSRRYLITVGGNITTGKCLDVAGGDATLHAPMQLFRCHGKENQQFEFHRDGTIRVMGKCLDIPDSEAYDHQSVQLFDCRANQKNQQFFIDTDNRIHVMDKCLDVPNGQFVNNNPLQLFRCHTLASQRFYFVVL